MNMNFKRKLPIPMDIKAEYPITPDMEAIKNNRDEEIKAVFEGKKMAEAGEKCKNYS